MKNSLFVKSSKKKKEDNIFFFFYHNFISISLLFTAIFFIFYYFYALCFQVVEQWRWVYMCVRYTMPRGDIRRGWRVESGGLLWHENKIRVNKSLCVYVCQHSPPISSNLSRSSIHCSRNVSCTLYSYLLDDKHLIVHTDFKLMIIYVDIGNVGWRWWLRYLPIDE